MQTKKLLEEYAAGELLKAIRNLPEKSLSDACEIRLRAGLPLIIRTTTTEHTSPYKPTARDLTSMLDKLASHSLYAFDSEIKNGFITIGGGHRVGICGRVALEGGKIKTIRHISGLNIRIARQIIGAADPLLPYLPKPMNTLIISPPGGGKTTVLRDLTRQLSLAGSHISVVDERSEIAGSHLGIQQNDLGPRTDVLDAAPKVEGMLMMLRAMSPDIICVDEIGATDDIEAIMSVACCGSKILASLHGESIEDLQRKPALAPLLDNKIFERYVFLTTRPKPSTLKAVYDKNFHPL